MKDGIPGYVSDFQLRQGGYIKQQVAIKPYQYQRQPVESIFGYRLLLSGFIRTTRDTTKTN